MKKYPKNFPNTFPKMYEPDTVKRVEGIRMIIAVMYVTKYKKIPKLILSSIHSMKYLIAVKSCCLQKISKMATTNRITKKRVPDIILNGSQ